VSTSTPAARDFPLLTYDEGRQKLFLFDGATYGSSDTDYWEWDPITAGWASYSTGDSVGSVGGDCAAAAYDPLRRRQVIVANCGTAPSQIAATWEIDTRTQTLYIRNPSPSPEPGADGSMVFDRARGVMVLYAGDQNGRPVINETWEYKVTNLANGEACTAAFASSCASGFCTDGVCCEVATCAGACKSCSVPGFAGTCVSAAPGTDVPGSCAAGLACDATGACKSKNGRACAAATECASGFCVDGVCCDSACTGTCASCNQAGRAGWCTPYPAGTDPEKECGQDAGACKPSCDGVSACALPTGATTCGAGGSGGNSGGSGGYRANLGGSGGSLSALGGRGGSQADAGADAGNKTLHKPVCDCALGKAFPSGSGWTLPLLLAGAAGWRLRKRRQPRPTLAGRL